MYKHFFKPIGDRLVAAIALIVLSPVLLLAMLLLAFANRGQIFFIQRRPGLNGKIFRILKLKTMNDRRDKNGHLLPDAQRLTPVGRIIRKASIDEIPQLINVLKGEMSLIGPRPLLEEYLALYTPWQARRHEVKPGITGWAQVNGRNAISWEQKFAYDVWYVDHISIALDLQILWRTIGNVLRGKGISAEGQATMEKFKGDSLSANSIKTTS